MMAIWRGFREKPKTVAEKKPLPKLVSGIRVEYYVPHLPNSKFDTFESHEPTSSGVVPQISITVPQRKVKDNFSLRFTGSLHVKTKGQHTFYLRSDDGSRRPSADSPDHHESDHECL